MTAAMTESQNVREAVQQALAKHGATRDALIRDKVGDTDWAAHLGHSHSLFVNATTWGLMLTGKLVSTHGETGLLAPPDDPEQLSACLLRMLRDRTLCDRLAAAGYSSATDRYASGPLAKRYDELIRRAVTKRKNSH